MNGPVVDITTTVLSCTSVCLNNGECSADGTCSCLPGYYGEFCQSYNGYSTIGAIAGAVICIVFLLLLTCMAFAAHIRGPPNGESRLTRLVSVEARGSSFDENSVFARNDFPPEYADVVSTGRGRRLSSLRLGGRGNSIDETEPRSPPPMYEIVIFGKKRKFSFRRGSKSRKASEIAEPTVDNKDCIIEEVNEKIGDDSVFSAEDTTNVTGNTGERNQENLTNQETGNTAAPDLTQRSCQGSGETNLEKNLQEQSVDYEKEINAKLGEVIVDTCIVENVTEINEPQRHRQKQEDEAEHKRQITIATS
ncbi:uncharacterized protein LOC117108568 isoform X2 [Anneissia japonica]|uniref:uncharacterized protein LOC117108568 isoform X2 n=1 Tax=Anneissia japonica TaxID=1529436 RepID=UPI001425B78D|nr:uncharacterized protein LOC117108568 isoform X2 [Anneissia japonica]